MEDTSCIFLLLDFFIYTNFFQENKYQYIYGSQVFSRVIFYELF